MTELSFELVGSEQRWEFPKAVVRVGRSPTCDLVLPSDQFPMVGTEHLIVRTAGGQCWVEDLKSKNGTYLNGNRVENAQLAPGDVLQLGAQGPELRVGFTLPEGAPPQVPPTQVQVTPTKVVQPIPPTAASQPPLGSERAAGSELSPGEEAMLEQKINALRNLVMVNLVLIVVLAGLLYRVSQQVDQNRQAIKDLDTRAQNAVALFQPPLNDRLNQFETRLDAMQKSMDGMDQKISRAEDRFVARLDRELPTMVEHVIQREVKKVREEVGSQQPQQRH
jgi:pSer/pThr/pTyr-binding forkhead associated (FHA) protein